MNAICIKDIKNFKNGEKYHICPVLSGYQVTDKKNNVTAFLDEEFKNHFEISKQNY